MRASLILVVLLAALPLCGMAQGEPAPRTGTWIWTVPDVALPNPLVTLRPIGYHQTEPAILDVGPQPSAGLDWSVETPSAIASCVDGVARLQPKVDGAPIAGASIGGVCQLRYYPNNLILAEWHGFGGSASSEPNVGPLRGDGTFR